MIRNIINKMYEGAKTFKTLMLVHDGKLRITKKGKVKNKK